jgi:2-keto-4-pentenoate hydratase/2-oxohepta-3-ene-1,7-dioic acid hydratase in catechol pathway
MLYKREVRPVNLFGMQVPEPRLLLDFLGFEKHVVQIREKRGGQIWPGWYDHAAYYIADLPPEKLFGSGQTVPIPDFVKAADYEFEIGCLVGKDCLVTDHKQALEFFRDHCFLTILNDWSARDVQMKDLNGLGPSNSKSIIGNSIGPKLVPVADFTFDEMGVMDMKMVLCVNGEQRNSTNYSTIYHNNPQTGERSAWSFPRLMTWLGRQNIAMQSGYLLGSGTVGSGCIAEFGPRLEPGTGKELAPAKYPWLKEGDVVRMEADGIGVLENRVTVLSHEYAHV